MSEDLDTKDPSGGHVALPRRLPLWPTLGAILVVVSASIGVGTWAYAVERTQQEHDEMIRRIYAYICLDCKSERDGAECRFVCGLETQP